MLFLPHYKQNESIYINLIYLISLKDFLLHITKLIQVLNLDVSIGAVVTSMYVSELIEVEVPLLWYIPLFSTVWMVYTVDRLLDSHRNQIKLVTYRHRFHKQYKKSLILVIGLLTIFNCAFILIVFPLKLILFGSTIFLFVAFYLITAQIGTIRIYFPLYKEVFTALGYSLGVVLLPYYFLGFSSSTLEILIFILVFKIALINLLLFSYFEINTDKLQQQQSAATLLGRKSILTIVWSLSFLSVSIAVILINSYTYKALVFMVMVLTLYIISINSKYFKIIDRYRILGDGVFLFPIIILFL